MVDPFRSNFIRRCATRSAALGRFHTGPCVGDGIIERDGFQHLVVVAGVDGKLNRRRLWFEGGGGGSLLDGCAGIHPIPHRLWSSQRRVIAYFRQSFPPYW